MPDPLTAVIVGAGQRGHHVYGAWALAHPDQLRFVAVADPDPGRRERFAAAHGIPTRRRFSTHTEIFGTGRIADAAVIATTDRHHVDPALAALALGYHVLLEKPMAATLEDCEILATAAKTAPLHVAHVLRFTPFFRTLHDLIGSGRLGDVVTVEHRENVVAWHMAHSYVRGNWARAAQAAPMIVAKCCHDFDILLWNLPSPVVRLSSFGSLFHFRPEHAPPGATARCTDGCPAAPSCPFDAQRLYLNPAWTEWPVHVITDDLSPEGRLEALRTGPYGRCVYRAGSDVVDHQTVVMDHQNGAVTTLVMHGHSHEESRTMRYDGTRATLRAVFGRRQSIEVSDHRTGETEPVPFETEAGGHGGGDQALLASFVESVRSGRRPLTDAAEAFESHRLAFAAETARIAGEVVEVGPLPATAAGE